MTCGRFVFKSYFTKCHTPYIYLFSKPIWLMGINLECWKNSLSEFLFVFLFIVVRLFIQCIEPSPCSPIKVPMPEAWQKSSQQLLGDFLLKEVDSCSTFNIHGAIL